MRVTSFAYGVVVAGALSISAATVGAQGQSQPPAQGDKAPAKFTMLNGVKAEPMAEQELKGVKGLHIHFTTPSENLGHPLVDSATGWHFVNHKENNLGKGQALPIAGPGYSGLCGAALLSGALTIPGQNTTTGAGGGC
jgi:hypothetical protein